MQVNKKEEDTFTPYTLEIKVETEEEHLFFFWLKFANITIPQGIAESINEFVGHAKQKGLPKPSDKSLRNTYNMLQQKLEQRLSK